MTVSKHPLFSLMQRLSREPLIHFLLLGAILFGAYGSLKRKHDGSERPKRIELTIGDLSQLDSAVSLAVAARPHSRGVTSAR